ncbi:MAG: hypothetical protein WD733_05810 [Bryobacterales bacterium]
MKQQAVLHPIPVFLPLTNSAVAGYAAWSARDLLPGSPALPRVETVSMDAAAKPDIYHLILDGHGHEDVFDDDFDLRQLGFGLTVFLQGSCKRRDSRSLMQDNFDEKFSAPMAVGLSPSAVSRRPGAGKTRWASRAAGRVPGSEAPSSRKPPITTDHPQLPVI